MTAHAVRAALACAALAWSVACIGQEPTVNTLQASGDYTAAIRASDPAPTSDATSALMVQANADRLTHDYRMRQENTKVYEVVVLSALALISLFVVLRFLTAHTRDSRAHVVNATGLIFIVFGTIMLGILAETDQHLTASVGILGAVAGYLFRSMRPDENAKDAGDKP